MKNIEKLNIVGDRVFLNPAPLLTFEELVQKSLGANTYRGFHKINKEEKNSGSAFVFREILTNNKNKIIKNIHSSKSEKCIDTLSKYLCNEIRDGLILNIRNDQLNSFNKIRKPVDIFIEHLVAMGIDFKNTRQEVTKWLFLPLDSQMFGSKFVFLDSEIDDLKIKRTFTFKDIKEEEKYLKIQNFLVEKANRIGVRHRIYFDLIWNNRYNSSGTNLIETNPKSFRMT